MSDSRMELIEQYAAGADQILTAARVVPEGEWDRSPGDGEWSARQVLVHLADSEIVGAGRVRQLLAEENPNLYMYQQAAWAERLGYATADVPATLELAAALRRHTADLLRRAVTEESWSRTAHHATRGPMTLETLLRLYIGHVEGHLEQLRALAQG